MDSNRSPRDAGIAIVVALDSIQGLQASRALARRGVEVIGLARDPNHFCCKTNTCSRVVEADTKSVELIECLERLGPGFDRPAVLVACTDTSVMVISRWRDRLAPWYRFVLPEHDVIERLMDKSRFYAYAHEQGLPVPATFAVHERADVERAAGSLAFPCVLKPSLRSLEWDRQIGAKVLLAESGEALLDAYDRCAPYSDAITVQEWIPGGVEDQYTCNCYFDGEGVYRLGYVSRKIRQWPPDFGIGSLREGCRNAAVLETTVRLFQAIGYRGLGYLEMKHDARSGRYLIIEPNVGRPTGGSGLAEADGFEMIFAMFCDAVGLPLAEPATQKDPGPRYIYLSYDLRSAWSQYWSGRLGLGSWWRSLRPPLAFTVLSRSDPAPIAYEFWTALRAAASGLVVRLLRRRRPRLAPALGPTAEGDK